MQLSLTAHTRAPRSRLFAHGDVGRSEASEHLPAVVTALDSNNLLRGRKTVTIVHNDASYRLQATKLGKLILTK